jgi:hypothetical protein
VKVCLFIAKLLACLLSNSGTHAHTHTHTHTHTYCFRITVNVGLVNILIVFSMLYFPLSCWPEHALLKMSFIPVNIIAVGVTVVTAVFMGNGIIRNSSPTFTG